MGRALRALLCSPTPSGPISSFNTYSSIFHSGPDSGDAGDKDMVPNLMKFIEVYSRVGETDFKSGEWVGVEGLSEQVMLS